uniref:Uncharacterized protein n=1 Tax=Meloidogyne enterolobii TaxID=390850 RepID=A0A6V7W670_MELEN|nr:unnamed protein product [Meloidogyne enterolobii]
MPKISKILIFTLFIPIFFNQQINCYILDSSQWIAPFNKTSRLRMLCVDNNEQWVMREGENPLVNNLIRHYIMCNPKYKIVLKTKKYEGLVWLMQSLAFCSILESTQKKLPYGGRSPEFHRDFQMNLLKAAFALV